MCSIEVKLTLFRSYCSPMYGVQLWWNYKKSTLNRLHIVYHSIFKLFIYLWKYESTSLLCTLFDVKCCQSVISNMVYFLNDILTSRLRFTSRIRKHWNKHLTETTVYIFNGSQYILYCLPNVIVWTSESHVLAVPCWVWKLLNQTEWLICWCHKVFWTYSPVPGVAV